MLTIQKSMLPFAFRSQLKEPTSTVYFFLMDQKYQPDGIVTPLNDIGTIYSKFAYILADRLLVLERTTFAGLAFISTACGLLPPGTELPSDPHMLLAHL